MKNWKDQKILIGLGIPLLIVAFIIGVNRPVMLECAYGPFKDKDGVRKTDVFPLSAVKINKILNQITFYPLKPARDGRHEGISIGPFSIDRKGGSYVSSIFKIKPLTPKEVGLLKNKQEFYWPEVKNDDLQIWFNRSTLVLEVVTPIPSPKKWIERYTCYLPEEKNKAKPKKKDYKI